MPISIKTDLEWGDLWYIKNDPDQFEYSLVGVVVLPGKQIKFLLDLMGDVFEVWDFECSKTPDENKMLNIRPKKD